MTTFARFHAFMAAAALAMSNASAAGAPISRAQALSSVGGYSSRGKGKTKSHDNGGTRAFQRLAMKRRNRARHRKAVRC